MTRPIGWVYEADIRGFFDHLDHEWLMRMIELRVGDPWILRLTRKWLKAGILEDGIVKKPTKGAPQGGPLSPMLANVYLHYVLDLWFERVIHPKCRGYAELTRFADDFVVRFERKEDAEAFAKVMTVRLSKFGLELATEKTRILAYGRKTYRRGQKEHFDFLGFRHHLGQNRKGIFIVIRIPSPKSVAKFLAETKQWLQEHRHDPPKEQQGQLIRKLKGFYQYFGLYHCSEKLKAVQREVMKYWFWNLRKQSQRSKQTWEAWTCKSWFRLPEPRLVHPTV